MQKVHLPLPLFRERLFLPLKLSSLSELMCKVLQVVQLVQCHLFHVTSGTSTFIPPPPAPSPAGPFGRGQNFYLTRLTRA